MTSKPLAAAAVETYRRAVRVHVRASNQTLDLPPDVARAMVSSGRGVEVAAVAAAERAVAPAQSPSPRPARRK